MRTFLALRRNVDFGLLLEEFRRQGYQIRELDSFFRAYPRRLVALMVRRKDPLSSAVIVDEAADSGGKHMMYAGVSIATEEFPSGTDYSLPTIDVNKQDLQVSIE